MVSFRCLQTEQEDVTAACSKVGLSADDFEINVEENFPVEGVGHLSRIAHVPRKSNKVGKEYYAGSGSTWPMQFELDLLASFYK